MSLLNHRTSGERGCDVQTGPPPRCLLLFRDTICAPFADSVRVIFYGKRSYVCAGGSHTNCNDPYYIVRSFGKNAIKFKRKTFHKWISYIPISGTSIIDVTLITCNAFNVEDYFMHEMPNPVVLYRNQHHFELRNQTNIHAWERLDTELPIHINTRYQPNETCRTKKTQKSALCSSSAIDSYTYKSEEVDVKKSICFVGASHARRLNGEAKKWE